MRKTWLAGAALVLTAAVVTVLVVGRPVTVETAQASLQSFSSAIDSEGTVTAPTQAVVAPMSGKVATVEVSEGQCVQVGSELLRMDDSLLSLRVDEAVAALNAAKEAEDSAQSMLSDQQKRAAMLAAQTASADLQDVTDTEAQPAAQEDGAGQVELARIRVSEARAQLDAARVTSCLAGQVLEVKVRAGQFASAGSVAATVATMDDLTIEAVVADLDAAGVTPGMAVELSGGCLGQDTSTGVVQEVKALAQTQQTQTGSRSAAVISIRPDDRALFTRLGSSVDLKIVKATTQAVGIPVGALAQGTAGLYVFRVSDGRLLKTVVEVGRINDDWAEVLSGLTLGDRVALDPAGLRDGQRVSEHAR